MNGYSVALFRPLTVTNLLRCSADRLLIGRYGIELIDLDFLPFDTSDVTSTTTGRPWLVDLTDINIAGICLAALGGLFAFVVIFFDQSITVRLVNAKEHKLKKGYGYDMDMMALCICTIALSLCGCPWLVSASECCFVEPSAMHCLHVQSVSSTDVCCTNLKCTF